ncbi:MAG: DNA polymerase III subunit beta [Chlamydiota bacterium]
MIVVIARQELLSLIGKIQTTVPSKPAIPILGNILLETQHDQLVLSATDLTVSARFSSAATVIEEGKIALPARKFFQLVRELRSPQIKITAEEGKPAEIIAGSSIFKINGMHHSEFPQFPELTASQSISLTSVHLKELLHRSAFCAAREDSRYVLNGICVDLSPEGITFTGTDGKRLARISQEVEPNPDLEGSYVLPLKSVEEMLRILDNVEEPVRLSFMEDKASFAVGPGILITKLLSGQYPDVQKVIPKDPAYSVQLHREELLSLLKQISLFTSENSHSVRFIFEHGELTLKATASELGEGLVSMPADCPQSRLEIAFNPFYFIDILRRSQDECITFSINDSFNPGLITDSTTSQFVIMPMRLEEQPEAPERHVSEKAALT